MVTLTPLGLRGGVWRARLSAPAEVSVTHDGREIPGVTVTPAGEGAELSVPVPPALLSDGVTTVLVTEAASGARLGDFAIIAGEALERDVRAELDLLRAELDMLKAAFRRLAARG